MQRLDHINIHVRDPQAMIAFLTAVVGAREGHRPAFAHPGHWLYLDDRPVIHLDLVDRDADFPPGIVNHIAFGVEAFEPLKARVEASGYPHKLAGIPGGVGQFFVEGPEGLRVELQFHR